MRPPVILTIVVLLSALALVQGCGPSARMDALRPAAVPLPGIRSLAVAEFTGTYGERARECFRQRLLESRRFGLALAADAGSPGVAVVRAEVSCGLRDHRGYEEQPREDTISRVVTERDGDGNVIRSFTEDVPVRRVARYAYVQRSARVEARMRVESGGRVLAEESDARRLEQRYGGVACDDQDYECPGGGQPLKRMPRPDDALEEMACAVGEELALRILPESYTVRVRLDEEGGELVRRGAQLADDDSWGAAVALWRRALEADPSNAPALYNLGVEQELRGTPESLRQAREFYSRAFGIEPKSLYAEAVERIKGRIRDADELARRISGQL